MSDKEENKDKVNEPSRGYTAPQESKALYNSVTISSLEEMRNDNYRHWSSLTPEQRLAEHYELLIRAYNYKDVYSAYDKIYFHE